MDGLLKFLLPSVPQGQPLQKGQNVADFPGYQKPQPAPQTIDASAISQAIGGAARGVGNFIGQMFQPTPSQPVMWRQPTHEQLTIQNGKMVPVNAPVYGPQQPSPMPSASPMAFQQGPSATPMPEGAAAQFRFQMGQNQYPQAAAQLQKMFGQFNSPLAAQIPEFVKAGEKYGVDPRVLALIAQIESSGGKQYPQESYNPFGYLVNGGGVQGLKNAGFTSLPQAIDALTGRFQRQPFQGYKTFYQDPSISNLQAAYNANPAEQSRYLNLSQSIIPYLQ